MHILLRLISIGTVFVLSASAYALSVAACPADAKLCPDGKTYVGRDTQNNCQWQKCPDAVQSGCDPYRCTDGTTVDRCSTDGTVINYFAAPCLTHGGDRVVASFRDAPSDHVNAEAITYVKDQGIVDGYPDGTFRPDQTINRAEFTKILVGAIANDAEIRACYDQPEPDHWAFFERMHDGWYAPYVCYAKQHRIIDGYPGAYGFPEFRPANSINFVEAAKILVKAYQLEAVMTVPACEGVDPNECPWFRSYVLILEMKGAIPTSITGFNQNITRGEMAEMIYRLKAGIVDKPSQEYARLERREHCNRMKVMGWGCE